VSVEEDTVPNHSSGWYALRVRSRYEQAIAVSLDGKGIETYVPMYRSLKKWRDRLKELHSPLFPGYVFCRLDISHRLPVLMTDGVLHFVGIGRQPMAIDDAEIESLQRLDTTSLSREPHPLPAIGEKVLVHSGPLRGVEGVLIQVNRESRLLLSVKLLQRAVSVEVDQRWVTVSNAIAV
jgi:transcription antitermination factor NusG